jgi:predicted nucleic acid-binding protein
VTYLDTSALVKRFVLEAGSREVRSLLTRGEPFASATIAYAELYSGPTRRYREGALSHSQYQLACRRFERDWMALVKVELDAEILSSALV